MRSLMTPLMICLALLTACGGGPKGEFATSPTAAPEYRLGVADILEVSVRDNPSFSAERVVVRPDGFITLPLIDDIRVVGLTPTEVKDQVVRKLAAFIKTPIVTVTLVELQSYEFYVVGNVRGANRYTSNRLVTVLQGLSMAGGFNEFASPHKTIIIRRFPDGQKRLLFDYDAVINGTRLKDNIYLQTGDTIVVP
ncbi:MAG: polysaccharide biosynthesis/export family protein [Bradymonadia bacterium]